MEALSGQNSWILWVMALTTNNISMPSSSRLMILRPANITSVQITPTTYNQKSQYLEFNLVVGWNNETGLIITNEKPKGTCTLKILNMIFVSITKSIILGIFD